mgnify:CR=1 FL=1
MGSRLCLLWLEGETAVKKKRTRPGRPALKVPTSSEAAILRAIWQLSELQRRGGTPTIAEVQRELRDGKHYNTVATLIGIMARKGYVKRVGASYRAVWNLDRCLRAALLQIVDDYQTTFMMVADIAANQ